MTRKQKRKKQNKQTNKQRDEEREGERRRQGGRCYKPYLKVGEKNRTTFKQTNKKTKKHKEFFDLIHLILRPSSAPTTAHSDMDNEVGNVFYIFK